LPPEKTQQTVVYNTKSGGKASGEALKHARKIAALNDLFVHQLNMDIGKDGKVAIDRIAIITEYKAAPTVFTYPAEEILHSKFSFTFSSHAFYKELKDRTSQYLLAKKAMALLPADQRVFVPLPMPYVHHGTEESPDIMGNWDQKTISFFVPIIAKDKFMGVVSIMFKKEQLGYVILRGLEELGISFIQLYRQVQGEEEFYLEDPIWEYNSKQFQKPDFAPLGLKNSTFTISHQTLTRADGGKESYELVSINDNFTLPDDDSRSLYETL
jgi:hypothetical protein